MLILILNKCRTFFRTDETCSKKEYIAHFKNKMAQKLLHSTQKKLLEALKSNSDDPLTIRALQELLNISSTSVVVHHLFQLEKKGYLKRNPYNPKDYQILQDEPEKTVTYLNLYGLATCGPNGSILDGNPADRIPVFSRLISFPAFEAFMVKAKGKSMEPRIFEGDLIIVRRTSEIISGKVYVCINDEEVLIKRVQQDKASYILHSYNLDYKPFSAANNFRVEGEVKGIISRKI